uniref:Uncharacterized protein n=1 Tax=Macrostomum lignano TaxID=282301 RepID=A0A1I8FPA5_9PLAT
MRCRRCAREMRANRARDLAAILDEVRADRRPKIAPTSPPSLDEVRGDRAENRADLAAILNEMRAMRRRKFWTALIMVHMLRSESAESPALHDAVSRLWTAAQEDLRKAKCSLSGLLTPFQQMSAGGITTVSEFSSDWRAVNGADGGVSTAQETAVWPWSRMQQMF